MIQGQRGVFGPGLLIYFRATPSAHPLVEIVLHSLEGWITWGAESNFAPGIRIPSQTVDVNTAYLVVPITDEQIEAIEERRTGDAFTLNIALRGLATIPNRRKPVAHYVQQQDGDLHPEPLPRLETQAVWESSNTGNRIRIEREHWLKILEGLGAGKRRLIELPQPELPSRDDKRWEECLRLLGGATQFYRTGANEQVLGNCRTIIEGVTEVLCNRWGIARDPKKPISVWAKDLPAQLATVWPHDPEDAKLLTALLIAAFRWASDSHHYGSGVPMRHEVAFALSLTTDLLAFGAQVLAATSPTP